MITTMKKLAVALTLASSVLLTAPAAFAHLHHHQRYCSPNYGSGFYTQGRYSSPYSGQGWYNQRRYSPQYQDSWRSYGPYAGYQGRHHHHHDYDHDGD